jgi:hypothetical protein
LIHRLLRLSDYQRWGNADNLETWWQSRTEALSTLIPPGSRVIEFGAGKCHLKACLDASCHYIACDIVERDPGTIICDLNRRPLPQLSHLHPNVAVFAGVLEYVRDVEAVVAWLSQFVVLCVFSYDCFPAKASLPGRVREKARRFYYGYLSDVTEEQLRRMFERHGFANTETKTWTTQRIFAFAVGPAAAPALSSQAAATLHCGAAQ